jgi:sodium transport system permease protein
MSLSNVKLIYLRELRDQLRDRRTLFTIFILPLMLYPLLGMSVFQVQQFLKEDLSKVRIIGTAALPNEPKLIEGGKFAPAVASEAENKLLVLDLVPSSDKSPENAKLAAEADIRAGTCDAVVYFPPDFAERLAEFRRAAEQPAAEKVPQPRIFESTASDKSKVAADRVDRILRHWREIVVEDNLRQSNVPVAAARPFEVVSTDVAEEVRRRAAFWSKILPFVLMVWALTGAFYPAIDLCAGEKERGTLETLLSSPAARGEIVWGKLLTVMTFSMATSLLNLGSMTATGTFIITQIQKMGAHGVPLEIGPPPLIALAWLALALVPISALFSALSLAVAAFARSSKEGQYYLMPLLMISLPLMMLPMLPNTQLDLGFALIPLSGLMLLLRSAIEGQYWEVLKYSVPVIGMTAACCLLAIRWAVHQFNDESVLFRESERLDVGLWLRHLVRDREDLPTAGEAILCGVMLLVIRFFAGLVAPPPRDWSTFVVTTAVLQFALIATPVLLMTIMLTRKPVATLLLGRPSFLMTLPAVGLLAVLLHPAMLWLSVLISKIYPVHPQVLEQLQGVEAMARAAPLWQAILLMALTPAICEELAFRGFILSGLRRTGHKWAAIALTSVFFGLAHGILQQSLSAFFVGMVIGYIAVKTGSIWPGILYHLVHNSLGISLGRISADSIQSHDWLRFVFEPAGEGDLIYRWPVAIVAALVGGGIIWWLKSLPYHHTAEECLQEALDHQNGPLVAKPAA